MKKFAIGFIAGILAFCLAGDIVRIVAEDAEYGSLLYKTEKIFYDPSIGLWLPLTGRCTTELRKPPGGTVTVMREYFGCNRIQNKISDILGKGK